MSVHQLQISELGAQRKKAIAALLGREWTSFLNHPSTILFATRDTTGIRALCVAKWFDGFLRGDILVLKGDPLYYPALFRAACTYFRSQAAKIIVMIHPEWDEIISPLLNEEGLIHSKPCLIRYDFDGFAFHPPWIDRSLELPEGFSLFPWQELKPEERRGIEQNLFQERVSAYASPFLREDLIEPLNSVGLRKDQEVIGWCITHRIEDDLIRYNAYYVAREWRKSAVSLTPLLKAMDIQRHSPIRWAELIVNPAGVANAWAKFVEKRLAPYAVRIVPYREFWWTSTQPLL